MDMNKAVELMRAGAVFLIANLPSSAPTYRLYRLNSYEWLPVPPQTAQELISTGTVIKTPSWVAHTTRYILSEAASKGGNGPPAA